ncbi:MAG: peptide deformylase [Candidatus Levybacteria bacterium]|nr:peptide deformylase [Candidatus Levybacteria bacterium]
MYSLVIVPNPVLVHKSEKVKHFDAKLSVIISEMTETLLATTDPVGVGLAAPQVGLPLQIFQMKPTEKSKVTTYINPKIIEESQNQNVPNFSNSAKVRKNLPAGRQEPKKGKLLEGCLSVPNIWGHVTRKKEVKLSWQDAKGEQHEKLFTGFPAVIVQHEMDHLNGVLFTKHVMAQNEKLYKSHKDDEGNDVFDEIKI